MNFTICFMSIISLNVNARLNEKILKKKLVEPMCNLIKNENRVAKNNKNNFTFLLLNFNQDKTSNYISLVKKIIKLDLNFYKTTNYNLDYVNLKNYENPKDDSLIYDFLKINFKLMENKDNNLQITNEVIKVTDKKSILNLFENKKLDLCLITKNNIKALRSNNLNLIKNFPKMPKFEKSFINAVMFQFELSEDLYSTFELKVSEQASIFNNNDIKLFFWTKNDKYFLNTNQSYNGYATFFFVRDLWIP